MSQARVPSLKVDIIRADFAGRPKYPIGGGILKAGPKLFNIARALLTLLGVTWSLLGFLLVVHAIMCPALRQWLGPAFIQQALGFQVVTVFILICKLIHVQDWDDASEAAHVFYGNMQKIILGPYLRGMDRHYPSSGNCAGSCCSENTDHHCIHHSPNLWKPMTWLDVINDFSW